MAELIVAVFDTAAHADAAEHDLIVKANIPVAAIRRYRANDPNLPHAARSTASRTEIPATTTGETEQPQRGGFMAWLFNDEGDHTSHQDRATYDEYINAGRIIISVQPVDQRQADHVMQVLEGHAPTDIEAHPETPVSGVESQSRIVDRAIGATTGGTADAIGRRHGEEVIPLAEEQLNVGKRVVDRGTTWIRRYVVEKPVEAQVTLRDETTRIERRTPVTSGAPGAGAFEERTVEVRNTTEEPVINKTAATVEEVVVRREGTERTETVRDTVRREEVDVQKTATDPSAEPRSPTNATE